MITWCNIYFLHCLCFGRIMKEWTQFTYGTWWNIFVGKIYSKNVWVRYWCSCLFYHEVSAQESLEETTLAAANVSKDITAKDAALGLLLLQVNLLISGHCRGQITNGHQRISSTAHACSQSATTFSLKCCFSCPTSDVMTALTNWCDYQIHDCKANYI